MVILNGWTKTISDNEELRIMMRLVMVIWVGNNDFVFPGHNGTVSVIGTDEKNGNSKGMVIDEELQDGDESMLYKKGYLGRVGIFRIGDQSHLTLK